MRRKLLLVRMPLLTALFGFLPFGAPAAETLGNFTKNFDDNSLSPHFTTSTDAACAAGSVTASGGALMISRPSGIGTNCANAANLASSYEVCGDFDISIDFNLVTFPTPSPGRARYATLYVWDKGGAGYLGIERFLAQSAGGCLPYANSYKIFHNTTDGCISPYIPTSQTQGKFRITRVGTTWQAFYWNGTSWSLARTVSGSAGSVGFTVYSGGNSPEAQLVAFDNLVVQSWSPAPTPALATWSGNGHSYQVVHVPCGITRAAANNAALATGGYLATINSSAENDFLFGLVSGRSELWFQDTFANGLGPWLGGLQPAGSAEPSGGWTWANTGEPFIYSAWAPGEPNNAFGGEEALHFFQAGGLIGKQWNDANSNAHIRGYVIEMEPPFGNHCDDFGDGVVDDSRFSVSASCGTVAETAGRFSVVNPAGCGYAGGLYSRPTRLLQGDLDIQVDFDLIGFAPSANAHRARVARLVVNNGTQEAVIERYTQSLGFCNPGVHNYKAWIGNPENCTGVVSWAATSDMNGRLRIARVGATLTLYYWQSGWVPLRSGSFGAAPLRLALDTGAPGNFAAIESAHEVRFDNLCVRSNGDFGPPVVTAPADASYPCASAIPAAAAEQATATDDVGVTSLTVAETSNGGTGSPVSPLVLTRTWTATDAVGNTASASQVITVIDDTEPALSVPADLAAVTGPGVTPCAEVLVLLSPGAATATDNCGTATVTVSGLPAGNLFPVGDTEITWTATDAVGNATVATQHVVVSCPVGSISGAASLLCNGQSLPANDVVVQLLHEGAPFRSTTTGGSGAFVFSDVRHGTYTVAITAPAGYAVAPDTRLVTLSGADAAVEPFAFTCLLSDLTGQVSGTCNASTSGLQGVTVDVYRDDGFGTDVLVATAATDATGSFRFDDLALGDYSVGVVLPLGMTGGAVQDVTLATPDGAVALPAFALACQPIIAQPRGMGYWKHQVNVYLTGKGHAQESLADLLHFVDELVVHFNENLVNPVVVYVPGAASTNDKLLQLQQLLTVNRGGTELDRAKQHLLALLLNVVSAKISQFEVISDNGANVSQAITHAHDLIVDGNPANDATARTIAETINGGQRVPAGLVPHETRLITYEQASGPEVAFGIWSVPNPVRGTFAVELAVGGGEPAYLDLLDITGRRVWRQSLFGAGRQSVRIGDGLGLASGVYRLRLVQAGQVASRAIVITQ